MERSDIEINNIIKRFKAYTLENSTMTRIRDIIIL